MLQAQVNPGTVLMQVALSMTSQSLRSGSAHSSTSPHVGGVPSKPSLQAQEKLPTAFVQIAVVTSPQPPLSTAHSSISVIRMF